MKDLLFLVHRIPFPPNKGDKIRSWNILAHLASQYNVHVGAFIDDPHDWQYTDRIDEIATSTFFQKLGRRSGTARSFLSLLKGEPLSCGYYRDRAMQGWVDRNVHGIANGGDCDFFNPDVQSDAPYATDRTNIVFTGAMDYWANVDAVTWFADDILPKIRAKLPDCAFWIVGSNPTPEIVKLGDRDGISVTGRVDDVRPFITHATLSVAPLRVARGIQNKVLEAMALAKTVVATPQAMEGIAAVDGAEVFVAETAEAFADSVLTLASSPDLDAVGDRARQRVLGSYGWLTSLQKFESILEGRPLDDKLDLVIKD